MKSIFALLMFIFLLPVCAHGEYWDSAVQQPVSCCEDRPGCQVLQTVMLGSFARFDPDDSLNIRVLSAALPRLAAITEDDFSHFTAHFDVDAETLRNYYYIALGNCLRSDIIVTPIADSMDEQNARTVLNLFLVPADSEMEEQRQTIREYSNAKTIKLLSEHADVPVGFVEYLIFDGSAA